MVISIVGSDQRVKATAEGTLVYNAEYQEGDKICVEGSGFAVLHVEDSLPPVYGYLNGVYELSVPFEEKRLCYSPKCFTGSLHLLTARAATADEIKSRRNLALNPLDNQQNTAFFPHARANIETRGESVFAARNVIDGITANNSHGEWPFQSWGINRRDDAEITIDFGREIAADSVVVTLRADFPHDNWWTHCTCAFSDGTSMMLEFCKSAEPQSFHFDRKVIRSVTLREFIKCDDDPSPFPALTEVEVWGVEV